MTSNRKWEIFAGLATLAISAAWATPGYGQTPEVKEKPAMYSYVAEWAIPRAQWGEMDKAGGASQKILDQAMAKGTIVGCGRDINLVHGGDGMTHDDWWMATSMAGILDVLNQFYDSGDSVSSALSSATKHSDYILVTRYYNWHSGSVKGGYTHISSYQLKADAPDDVVDTLSKSLVVPLLEKLLADGTIAEYEVDTEQIHTENPNTFWIIYLTPTAEGLDKVDAALGATLKSNPLAGPAFDSMVDFSVHHDELTRSIATYK